MPYPLARLANAVLDVVQPITQLLNLQGKNRQIRVSKYLNHTAKVVY